jgi:hypothetical protein
MKKASSRLDSKKIMLAQVLLTLALSWYVLSPNLGAHFGVIDDHEIMRFLGGRRSLPVAEIWGKLMETEASVRNVTTRFRPCYYFLRLVETSLWGDSALRWYAARVAMFFFTALLAWRALMRPLGVMLSGAATLVLFTAPYWGDVFARLGPSETYCSVALALYALAWLRLWHREGNAAVCWLLLGLAAVVCLGSKENFVLLVPATALLGYRAYRQGALTGCAIAVNAAVFGFGAFIAGVIVTALGRTGADVYCNPVSPGARMKALVASLSSAPAASVFLPFCCTLLLALLLLSLVKSGGLAGDRRAFLNRVGCFLLIESAAAAVCLFQILFYNGDWPTGMRYDFPGMLALRLSYIVLIYFMADLLCALYLCRGKAVASAPLLVTAFLLGGYFLLLGVDEVREFRATAKANAVDTGRYFASFCRVVAAAKARPELPIVLEVGSFWDVEPVDSVRAYLKSYGVRNPLLLKTDLRSRPRSGMEIYLDRRLKKMSEQGDAVHGLAPLYPAAMLNGLKEYYVVSFSGASPLAGIKLGRIW